MPEPKIGERWRLKSLTFFINNVAEDVFVVFDDGTGGVIMLPKTWFEEPAALCEKVGNANPTEE
jgi:pantothenate kinase